MEKMTIKELFAILDSESATMAEKRAARDELESRADEGLFFGDDGE